VPVVRRRFYQHSTNVAGCADAKRFSMEPFRAVKIIFYEKNSREILTGAVRNGPKETTLFTHPAFRRRIKSDVTFNQRKSTIVVHARFSYFKRYERHGPNAPVRFGGVYAFYSSAWTPTHGKRRILAYRCASSAKNFGRKIGTNK